MVSVSINKLEIGDLILVKPGELIPADGKIYRGGSSVNQASITGESVPVDKSVGDEVFTGTLNGEGVLYIEVTQSAESTLFAKIIKLVEEAENEVPESRRFIKRFESMYARIVVIATVALIVLATPVLGWDWDTTFYKAMVFLVVASLVRWYLRSCLRCCRRFPIAPEKAYCSKAAPISRIWHARRLSLLIRPVP